jgi:flagellin
MALRGVGVGTLTQRSSLIGRNLDATQRAFHGNVTRLSSGRQIGGPENAGHAAELLLSTRFAAQAGGLSAAIGNVSQGRSLIQTAEGGLSNTADLLGRARELAVQSANGTLSGEERAALQSEFDQTVQEIDRQAGTTQFNGRNLLNGSTPSVDLQAGANNGEQITLNLPATNSAALGLTGANVTTQTNATAAIDQIDQALETVSGVRSGVGAQANRLEATETSLIRTREDFVSAESRIADTDVASESTQLVANHIRQQKNVALAAQSNISALAVLRLFGHSA